MARINIDQKYMNDEGLTQSAQQMLTDKTEAYMVSLITQAALSESRDHVGNGKREITATHVVDADLLCRRGLQNKKMSTTCMICRGVQLVASIAVGVGASNFTQMYGIISVCIGTTAGFIAYILELDDSRKGWK